MSQRENGVGGQKSNAKRPNDLGWTLITPSDVQKFNLIF